METYAFICQTPSPFRQPSSAKLRIRERTSSFQDASGKRSSSHIRLLWRCGSRYGKHVRRQFYHRNRERDERSWMQTRMRRTRRAFAQYPIIVVSARLTVWNSFECIPSSSSASTPFLWKSYGSSASSPLPQEAVVIRRHQVPAM